MIQDETQGWTERWGKRDFRDINSPPCFLAFSLSFFNLISSKVFIPKFKLSSGSTEQFRKWRRILPKILGINPGHTVHELKTPEQVRFRKTGSFFHPPREKSTFEHRFMERYERLLHSWDLDFHSASRDIFRYFNSTETLQIPFKLHLNYI